MGYFNDGLEISKYIKIDGVAMPETSEDVVIENINISDTATLADGITLEGDIVGVKHSVELKYAFLTLEHYLLLYNATQRKYDEGLGLFFDIEVPCDTEPDGIFKFRGYFMSKHKATLHDTTEKHGAGDEYWRGGAKYDALYKDVVFSFVQK